MLFVLFDSECFWCISNKKTCTLYFCAFFLLTFWIMTVLLYFEVQNKNFLYTIETNRIRCVLSMTEERSILHRHDKNSNAARLSSELRNRVKKGNVMLSVLDRNWLIPVPTILLKTTKHQNTPPWQQSTISHNIIHARRLPLSVRLPPSPCSQVPGKWPLMYENVSTNGGRPTVTDCSNAESIVWPVGRLTAWLLRTTGGGTALFRGRPKRRLRPSA